MAGDNRPNPEALLTEVEKASRGRLKIFLGAYPGVGKTFSMLQAAHEMRRQGGKVAVGVVETHGRAETEALLRGLDVIPRKKLNYRGRIFGEMDLDAILWEKPALVLVDELAHSNIPGSRHEKRWQDVEELLAAGIDVYTTLNIQHLESVNDIVERIAKTQVRETLPDRVLELANEIELVDLPPEGLLKRLHDGKVYIPEQAGRAMRHFFSKGTLTALREMAMRIAANRVDQDMLQYMQVNAIPGPWPANERLLVCLGPYSSAKTLVRTGKRMADRNKMPWIVLHLLDPGAKEPPAETSSALRLAERLGAEVVVEDSKGRVVDELLYIARKRNVTRLLIGGERPNPWRTLMTGGLRKKLLNAAGDFEVTVLGVSADEKTRRKRAKAPRERQPLEMKGYIEAVFASLIAAAIGYSIWEVLPLANLSLIFLSAVLFIATRNGLGPALVASGLSFSFYNFFFTEPYFTFNVFKRDDVLTLVFFLLISIVVGDLAARLKRQLESIRASAKRTHQLYDFSRKVLKASSLDDTLWASVSHVANALSCSVLVLMPDKNGRLEICSGMPPEDTLSLKDRSAADWAWEKGAPAGWSSGTLPSSRWLFLPMKTPSAELGVIGVSFEDGTEFLSPDRRNLLDTLIDQVALAVERMQLAEDMEEARVLTETEQLRTALLSSVSHDLRTPLVSIIGAATSLDTYGETLSDSDRKELIGTVLEEADRLNRYVQNLLDMTRLGYGALKPNLEWSDLHEIGGRVVRRAGRLTHGGNVCLNFPADLPLVHVDPVLIEQVLVNLTDNALKYSGNHADVTLGAHADDQRVVIEVADQGPGISEADRERVFDRGCPR